MSHRGPSCYHSEAFSRKCIGQLKVITSTDCGDTQNPYCICCLINCYLMRRNYLNQKSHKNAQNPENRTKYELFLSTKDERPANWGSIDKYEAFKKMGININPNASSCHLQPTHRIPSPQKSLFTSKRITPPWFASKKTLHLNSTAHRLPKCPPYRSVTHCPSPDSKEEKDVLRQTDCSQSSCENKSSPQRIEQYSILKLLGKGRFGSVFLAIHRKTGFVGALKVIDKVAVLNIPAEHQQKMIKQLINEIKIQAFLNHPNLIQLYDFFRDGQRIYIFMEVGINGHLFDILLQKGSLLEETTSIVTRQIIQGINYMHSKMVIHRDIKLQNIVFTCGMAKICDFGWSIYEPKEFRSTICGTPLYLSPEILKGKKYNQKIDIWAIGTLAHEMATGKNPFGIRTQQQLGKIVREGFEMSKGSPELKSFITFILRKQPKNRPTGEVLLKHPFITKYGDIQTAEQICQLDLASSIRFS